MTPELLRGPQKWDGDGRAASADSLIIDPIIRDLLCHQGSSAFFRDTVGAD